MNLNRLLLAMHINDATYPAVRVGLDCKYLAKPRKRENTLLWVLVLFALGLAAFYLLDLGIQARIGELNQLF